LSGQAGRLLVVLAGLPAAGKSTVSRLVAARLGAAHLRIDTIEQAVVRSGLAGQPVGPVGYLVGYALAADLLQTGLTVLADSVNPLPITRAAWRDVAAAAGAGCVEVEVICSDPAEHRRRVGSRAVDHPDLTMPTWADIVARDYQPWDPPPRLVIDTSGRPVADCVAELLALVEPLLAPS
jgi:predicted kinase